MAKTYWLIDATTNEHYYQELVDAIQRHGDEVVSICPPEPPYVWDDTGRSYRERIPRGACVISLGDIGLIQRVIEDDDWIPGVFANIERSFCSQYLPTLGRYWVNRDYVMLPYGELMRCKEFLFRTLGIDRKIFVRPDSPLKIFTGTLVSQDSYAKDVEYLGFYEFPVESLVVVSSPKTIVREWRFVVVNSCVIAGSQYKEGKQMICSPNYTTAAFELAQQVAAAGFSPAPVWILDICQTEDEKFHLLEIGCFSFANLYGCDKDVVVAGVSAAAQEIWRKEVR